VPGVYRYTVIVQVATHRRAMWGEFRTTVPAARSEAITCAAVETILSVIQVIISVIVIFLVLMHSGKDSGLSGAFGVGSGTGPLGGGSMVERNLNRWTIFFAILFLLNAIVLLKRPWA
jgi:preprotein translocase subunit SecG